MNPLFPPQPGTYAGLKLIIVPYTTTIPRTWRERLFSWPWRPMQTEKVIENVACPDDGESIQMGNTLFCSPKTAGLLERMARK